MTFVLLRMFPHHHTQNITACPRLSTFAQRECNDAAGGDSPSEAIDDDKRPRDGRPMTHDAPAGQWSRGVLVEARHNASCRRPVWRRVWRPPAETTPEKVQGSGMGNWIVPRSRSVVVGKTWPSTIIARHGDECNNSDAVIHDESAPSRAPTTGLHGSEWLRATGRGRGERMNWSKCANHYLSRSVEQHQFNAFISNHHRRCKQQTRRISANIEFQLKPQQ